MTSEGTGEELVEASVAGPRQWRRAMLPAKTPWRASDRITIKGRLTRTT
jgi:hypothetical protein